MDKIFEFIYSLPLPFQVISLAFVGVWVIEISFFPFNMNRMISRMDKINDKLDKILELCGKDQSIRADNSKVLSLLLGDVLENRKKKDKDKG